MADITMFDVKEKRIHNEKIREMMCNCYTIRQTMEIRRLRWLEKLSSMPETRNPRKIFISWIPQPRPTGSPCQTISKAFAHTVGEVLKLDTKLDNWMTMIREDPNRWGSVVEEKLELHEGAYRGLKKTQHQRVHSIIYLSFVTPEVSNQIERPGERLYTVGSRNHLTKGMSTGEKDHGGPGGRPWCWPGGERVARKERMSWSSWYLEMREAISLNRLRRCLRWEH
eukprot:scaffold13311_cov161-Cylindrotheca_fusiformis.AAC.6